MITPPIQKKLYEILTEEVSNKKGKMLEVGGIEDHIHLLAKLPATVSISEFVQNLKTQTTTRIQNDIEDEWCFKWQTGYGAFSTSFSQVEALVRYIQNQEKHHKGDRNRNEYELLARM